MAACRWLGFHVAALLLSLEGLYGATTKITERRNLTASVGQPIVLRCDFSESNMLQITWKKNQNETLCTYKPSEPEESNWDTYRWFNISEVQLSDAGNYTCTMSSKTFIYEMEWQVIIKDTGNSNFSQPGSDTKKLLACPIPAGVGAVLILVGFSIMAHCCRRKQKQQNDQCSDPIREMADAGPCLHMCKYTNFDAHEQKRHNRSQYFVTENVVHTEVMYISR